MFAQPSRPLSRAEVREVDRRAIEELGVPGVVLMENAGLGLTRVVLAELAALGAAAAGPGPVIVCGRGNNGGDGLVLARQLELAGWAPRVAFCGEPARVDRASDGGINLTIVERSGTPLEVCADGPALAALLARWSDAPLLVDALYGTGLAGPLREPGLGLVQALEAAPAPKVAVDLPSGLDCDLGVALGAAVRAVRTVTFVAPKLGFDRGEAARYLGAVEVVPIGCPRRAWSHVG